MAVGWGEALLVAGSGAAGGFKAAGEVAEEKIKTSKEGMMQAALNKRATDLERFKAGEAQKGRDITVSEGRLDRESRESIAAGKTGATEQKYNFLSKIFGDEKAKSLLESSFKKDKSGANAKLQVDTLIKAYEMREAGASDDDINAVLKTAGIPEWVRTKTGDVLKSGGFLGFGQKEEAETTFGPGKGLLGGDRGEDTVSPDEKTIQPSDKGVSEFDRLINQVNGASTEEPGSGLLQQPQQEDTFKRGSYTDPGEQPINFEDMKKVATQIGGGIEKTGDVVGAVQQYFIDRGMQVGQWVIDGVAWMIENQSEARKETFGK